MLNDKSREHIEKAEGYLLLVESSFPNLSVESQERLRLAEIHCNLAEVYQLEVLKEVLQHFDTGVSIGTTLDFKLPEKAPWWQFWRGAKHG